MCELRGLGLGFTNPRHRGSVGSVSVWVVAVWVG